jgi:predicted deacylase
MLAHYLDAVILPMVDLSVDLHTAGHSGDSIPSTNLHHIADTALMARTLKAAEAFGAPFNVVFGGVDEGETLTSSVEARGIPSLGTELGGWGRVHIEGLRIGRRAVRNILRHAGVIEGSHETAQRDGSAGTRHMKVGDPKCYSFAPRDLVGEAVKAGDPADFLHFVEDIDRPPVEVRFRADGILWMSAGPSRVARGDAAAVVMDHYAG